MKRTYQTQGAGASHVRVGAGQAGGWGWLQAGKESESGVVLQPAGQLADGPQNLGDTQDIHHHLPRVSSFLSRYREIITVQTQKHANHSHSNTNHYHKIIHHAFLQACFFPLTCILHKSYRKHFSKLITFYSIYHLSYDNIY